jgi:hypothetical protein
MSFDSELNDLLDKYTTSDNEGASTYIAATYLRGCVENLSKFNKMCIKRSLSLKKKEDLKK